MPQLADRDTHEQAITGDLAGLFARQADEVRTYGSAARWGQFRVNLQQAIQRRFLPLILSVGAGMPRSSASPELLLLGTSKHASTLVSMQLADEIVARSQASLAKGATPDQVFSEARAKRIAVTEVTRAVTHAERFAAATFQIPDQRRLVAVWRTAIKGVCEFCDRFEGQPESVWAREVPGGPPAHEWCRCYLSWE